MVLSIDHIGAGGDGVAISENTRIYVSHTAPGDVLSADVSGERGTLVELHESSEVRVPPVCAHYGVCGGCSLQHVSSKFYLKWKRQQIVDALSRVNLEKTRVAATVETHQQSRRRAVFSVRKTGRELLLGFKAPRSITVVDLKECHILHPGLWAKIPYLRDIASLVDGVSFTLTVILCANGLDVEITGRELEELFGPSLMKMTDLARKAGIARLSVNGEPLVMLSPPVIHFDDVAVTPPPGAFLQASEEGEKVLLSLVKDASSGARKIADLFSGCGTFALPLAKRASVFAVDSDAAAIAALSESARNAQSAGAAISPVRAEVRNLFGRPLTAGELKQFDAIVFDPPRAGASAQARELAKCEAPIIVGISCNPASFARDARTIVDGGYVLSQVTPVDQFIYSSHVELVGVFRKA